MANMGPFYVAFKVTIYPIDASPPCAKLRQVADEEEDEGVGKEVKIFRSKSWKEKEAVRPSSLLPAICLPLSDDSAFQLPPWRAWK